VVVYKAYPPDEMVVASLIRSLGVPVRVWQEAVGSVYGITAGPLGEVKIAVPEMCAEEVKTFLAAESVP